MSEDDVAVVRGLYAAMADYTWNENVDPAPVVGRWFHPEFVFARMGGEGVGQTGVWRGVAAAWPAMAEWLDAWDDVRIEAERIVDVGERVLVLARQTGRGKRSGVRLDIEYGELITVRDRRIVRWDLYIDRAAALRAAHVDASDC
jgi:ketosteroid isomerase-like protein